MCIRDRVATGRQPKTDGLGLENAGIALGAKGEVPVDAYNATSCPSIYAVGDVTDRVQLTPVAIREGHAFADTVFGGKPRTIHYDAIPSAVFSQPPLAGVGLTEAQAHAAGPAVKIFTSDFRPMKNMFHARAERGFYKLVVDEATAVSYTHLDVYKRQDEFRPAEVAGEERPGRHAGLAILLR